MRERERVGGGGEREREGEGGRERKRAGERRRAALIAVTFWSLWNPAYISCPGFLELL